MTVSLIGKTIIRDNVTYTINDILKGTKTELYHLINKDGEDIYVKSYDIQLDLQSANHHGINIYSDPESKTITFRVDGGSAILSTHEVFRLITLLAHKIDVLDSKSKIE